MKAVFWDVVLPAGLFFLVVEVCILLPYGIMKEVSFKEQADAEKSLYMKFSDDVARTCLNRCADKMVGGFQLQGGELKCVCETIKK